MVFAVPSSFNLDIVLNVQEKSIEGVLRLLVVDKLDRVPVKGTQISLRSKPLQELIRIKTFRKTRRISLKSGNTTST